MLLHKYLGFSNYCELYTIRVFYQHFILLATVNWRRLTMPRNEDDIDETFISQFETTLSIRPTNEVSDVQDISIDHTTVLPEHPKQEKTEQISRSSDSLGVSDVNSTLNYISSDIISYLKSKKFTDSELHQINTLLAPSPNVDLNLNKYTKTLNDFFDANPQIVSESPKFDDESKKTLVLLSPYATEHVFGRSWVSKAYLSTIFERPQRLLASCIGIAAASSMYPYFFDVKTSRRRGSLFSDHVKRVHGVSWPERLLQLCLEAHNHLKEENIEIPDEWNAGDIYLTPRTITAIEDVLGTLESAVDSLFDDKPFHGSHNLVFAAIRPPGHHAHSSLPSGFCVLNNAQIAIEYSHIHYGVSHCAILDIDLHHGDGTQDICWERAGFCADFGKEERLKGSEDDAKVDASYPKIGYFSLHDVKSYPTELGFASKENLKNASLCIMDHDLNIWNVHLQEWSSEDEFYKFYQTKYVAILNRANQFFNQAKKRHELDEIFYQNELSKYQKYLLKPHLYKQAVPKPTPPPPFKPLILISAGFDASEYENPQMQRHGVNVPTSFYARFTKDVVRLAKIHTGGKVLSLTEGGYLDGALCSGIFSHLIGLTNNHGQKDSDDILLWNNTWGSEHVIKELCKGCKRSYSPYKNPRSEITIWANEVIKLGRLMMPNAILPANHIYQASGNMNHLEVANDELLRGAPFKDALLKQILNDEEIDGALQSHLKEDQSGRRRLRNLRSQTHK